MFKGLRNLRMISAIVLNRMELYSKLMAVEAKIEMALIVRRLVWAAVGIVFVIFTLAILHAAILSGFWYTEYRIAAFIVILLIDAGIAGAALYFAYKPAEQETFAVTKQQLAQDLDFVKESI